MRSIVFAERFARQPGPRDVVPVIGRHSRPEAEKWPDTRREFLRIYPASKNFDVRFLGVGPSFSKWFPHLPGNWRAYQFDTSSVRPFLNSIDYYVYFHRSDWIEALGIATVEAMAAGAIAILPDYMRINFGTAAKYSKPYRVPALVKSLHADHDEQRKQRQRGLRYVRKYHSPKAYLDAVRKFLPRPRKRKLNQEGKRVARHVVVIADFSDAGLQRFQLACMLQALSFACDDLILFNAGPHRNPIANFWRNNPIIKGRTRWGDRSDDLSADLAIIDLPTSVANTQITFERISCTSAVVIFNVLWKAQDVEALDTHLKQYFRHVTWAPRSRTGRLHLEELRLSHVEIEPYDWTPDSHDAPIGNNRRENREFYLICNSDLDRSRALKARIIESLPANSSYTVLELGRLGQESEDPQGVTSHFSPAELSPELLLRRARAIVLAYHLTPWIRTLIERARALGVEIIDVFGADNASNPLSGPNWAEFIARVEKPGLKPKSPLSALHPANPWGDDCVTRLVRWKSSKSQSACSASGSAEPNSAILMLSQNGIGLGHLVRQLAIARRMNPSRNVIFASIGQAFDIARKFGYEVEHIPSHLYTDVPYHAWNKWLAAHLLQIIYFHKVGTIVLDGSTPYDGLLEALQARPETKAVWIRRAMWTGSAEASLKKLRLGKLFDLVLEPKEIAERADHGPTADFRRFATSVNPISLVGPADLLSREDASLILGIDPKRTTVLVQLGSGNNRNLPLLTDRIVNALATRGEFQVVESEWMNSQFGSRARPDVLRLKAFPTAIFFNAFDFSFSAAGYNAFHEIMGLGLPTIFIANRREYMDNQLARTEFAAQRGAAVSCDGSLASISRALEQVSSAKSRRTMKIAMRACRSANGAASAARLIERLADS